jgi:hypothetical protein
MSRISKDFSIKDFQSIRSNSISHQQSNDIRIYLANKLSNLPAKVQTTEPVLCLEATHNE